MKEHVSREGGKSHNDILATIAMSGANARLPAGESSFRMETLNDEVDDIARSLEARRGEPVDREKVREVLKREDPYDDNLPGGMIANLMHAMMPPEALAPLRDDSRCAWCAAPPAPGAKLLVCSRCRGAAYCNKSCFKAAWKDGHKQACSTHDERVDHLMELWESQHYGQPDMDDDDELTRAAADAAVRITGERVPAAYHMLMIVLTGGLAVVASDDDIAAGLSLLFGVKNLRAADLHAVEESLSDEKRATLWARRQQVAAEKEAMRQRIAPVLVDCAHIYQELTDTMGGCVLFRHQNGPTHIGTHRSNREVVDFHYRRLHGATPDDLFAQRFARENRLAEVFVPCFLALADELLTPPINYEARANGGRSEAVMRRRHAALRARVEAAWVFFAHAHGDAEAGASDAAIIEFVRARERVFRHKQYLDDHNPVPMQLRPGWWVAKNQFAGAVPHHPTRRQAKMEKRRHQARESARRAEALERMKREAAEARAASR